MRVHALNEDWKPSRRLVGGSSVRVFSSVGRYAIADDSAGDIFREFVPRVWRSSNRRGRALLADSNSMEIALVQGSLLRLARSSSRQGLPLHVSLKSMPLPSYSNTAAARSSASNDAQGASTVQSRYPLVRLHTRAAAFSASAGTRGLGLRCDFNRAPKGGGPKASWKQSIALRSNRTDTRALEKIPLTCLSTLIRIVAERRICRLESMVKPVHHGYMEEVNKKRHFFRLINAEQHALRTVAV